MQKFQDWNVELVILRNNRTSMIRIQTTTKCNRSWKGLHKDSTLMRRETGLSSTAVTPVYIYYVERSYTMNRKVERIYSMILSSVNRSHQGANVFTGSVCSPTQLSTTHLTAR